MKKAFLPILTITILTFLVFPACGKNENMTVKEKKIKVVTTIFPLYDFARQVGRERIEVNLLLPPGVEAHAFEPRPADIRRIQNADIFLFTREASPSSTQARASPYCKEQMLMAMRGTPIHSIPETPIPISGLIFPMQ